MTITYEGMRAPDHGTLVMINPNTSKDVTSRMLSIARRSLPLGVKMIALTALSGARLILDTESLVRAETAVVDLQSTLPRCNGVIVAGFGDPGVDALRRLVDIPVTGLGEASFEIARRASLPFAVITTTPALVRSIERQAHLHAAAPLFRGVFIPDTDDPAALMADQEETRKALAGILDVAQDAGAKQVIVGGGPLAEAARALEQYVTIPVIDPVTAAVSLALERAKLTMFMHRQTSSPNSIKNQ